MIPELDLADPALHQDPFTSYGAVREQAPVARLTGPGFGPLWIVTRHADARAMLTDPRFALGAGSFQRPDVPEHCRSYLRTLQEMEGAEHQRLRRLAAPAFTARRAEGFSERIELIAERLLDEEPEDLLAGFAQPLAMEVICELVGVPEADRPRWHEYGRTVVAGSGAGFTAAVPGIIDGARMLTDPPASEFLALLAGTEGLTEPELVTLVWQLVMPARRPPTSSPTLSKRS